VGEDVHLAYPIFHIGHHLGALEGKHGLRAQRFEKVELIKRLGIA
jgi:hypothetical protein